MSGVLLVHAGIGDCGFRSYGAGMDGTWLNHGLASIGAWLGMHGVEFDYLDLRKLRNWSHFSRTVRECAPEVVGISATTVDYDVALRVARTVKDIAPGARVVFGGIHASVCSAESSGQGCFDHVVTGEGEKAFLAAAQDRLDRKVIKGERIEELDEIPHIDRDVFGRDEVPIYRRLFQAPFATFIASRGCPYNCSFCQPAERIVFGRRTRTRSPGNLLEEIRRCAVDRGLRSYLIHDDCILWNTAWAEEFASLLERDGLRLPFAMQTRADLVCRHAGLIGRFARAGLRMLLIGFESGSQQVLDLLKKRTTVEQNLQAARICRGHGVGIWANYMFGIPGETRADVMDTVRMVREIRPDVCSASFFTPYPGSDLAGYCEERGLSAIARYADYRRNPSGRKVKGVDYRFLRRALRLSRGESVPVAFGRAVRRRLQHALRLQRRP